jgi:hypothetical protein
LVEGITTTSSLGLITMITDCEGADSTIFPSGTGLPSSTYSDIEDGETITDVVAMTLSNAMLGAIDVNLMGAGYTSTLTIEGGFLGFLMDSEGDAISGASITCAAGTCPSYYPVGAPETIPTGGWFYDGTTGEVATETNANGMFIIPAAPITTYNATADGYTFDSLTSGSLPGMALIIALYADAEVADTGEMSTGTSE